MNTFFIKRTTADDVDFKLLIQLLDHELWNELNEDQATYDQYNKVRHIQTAVVAYKNDQPTACGCFKEYEAGTVEIKRMFVKKEYRGQGLSKVMLAALEKWAIESGYTKSILETSVHFNTAIRLYQTNGYNQMENYPPYQGLLESVCLQKMLV